MDLDALVEEILVDAYDEHEQMGAFQCAISELPWPCGAKLGDMDLVVRGVDWEGQGFSGLEAAVVYEEHVFEVAFHKLLFPEGSVHALHVAALRRWLGLDKQNGKRVGRSLMPDGTWKVLGEELLPDEGIRVRRVEDSEGRAIEDELSAADTEAWTLARWENYRGAIASAEERPVVFALVGGRRRTMGALTAAMYQLEVRAVLERLARLRGELEEERGVGQVLRLEGESKAAVGLCWQGEAVHLEMAA